MTWAYCGGRGWQGDGPADEGVTRCCWAPTPQNRRVVVFAQAAGQRLQVAGVHRTCLHGHRIDRIVCGHRNVATLHVQALHLVELRRRQELVAMGEQGLFQVPQKHSLVQPTVQRQRHKQQRSIRSGPPVVPHLCSHMGGLPLRPPVPAARVPWLCAHPGSPGGAAAGRCSCGRGRDGLHPCCRDAGWRSSAGTGSWWAGARWCRAGCERERQRRGRAGQGVSALAAARGSKARCCTQCHTAAHLTFSTFR